MKHCPQCNQALPVDQFPKNSKTADGLHCYCKTCKKEYHLKWYHKNKDKNRAAQLKHKYGLSTVQYNQLLQSQNGCCGICGTNAPTGIGTWHVDHCHTSGQVRGLLCSKCNHALGLLNDDRTILLKAIDYLDRATDQG
jgi:hypothetical protein